MATGGYFSESDPQVKQLEEIVDHFYIHVNAIEKDRTDLYNQRIKERLLDRTDAWLDKSPGHGQEYKLVRKFRESVALDRLGAAYDCLEKLVIDPLKYFEKEIEEDVPRLAQLKAIDPLKEFLPLGATVEQFELKYQAWIGEIKSIEFLLYGFPEIENYKSLAEKLEKIRTVGVIEESRKIENKKKEISTPQEISASSSGKR